MNQVSLSLDCLSTEYVEALLEDFLRDPASVPESWRGYFQEVTAGAANGHKRFGPSFSTHSLFNPPPAVTAPVVAARPAEANGKQLAGMDVARLQDRVDN